MTQREADELLARHGITTPTQGRTFVIQAAKLVQRLERQVAEAQKARARKVPKDSMLVLKTDHLDPEDLHRFNQGLRAAGSQHRCTVWIPTGSEIDVLDVSAQQELMVKILEQMPAEAQADALERLAAVLAPPPETVVDPQWLDDAQAEILGQLQQTASPEEMRRRREALRDWAYTVTEDEEEE